MENSQNATRIKDDKPWGVYENQILGEGSFATVYKGKNLDTMEIVAIKVISNSKIRMSQETEKVTENEIRVLLELSAKKNPYVIKILDYFEYDGKRYTVLEYCSEGTLTGIIGDNEQLSEVRALEIAYQVVTGLSVLKQLKIIHRDIKPDNIFVHSGIIKIGDFGFANMMSKFETDLGSPLYMAPEFFIPGNCPKTKAVDIWAFGCLVYLLLYGHNLFSGSSGNIIQNIKTKVIKLPDSPNVKELTRDMVLRCLDRNPRTRITIEELQVHECFRSCRTEVLSRLDWRLRGSIVSPDWEKSKPQMDNCSFATQEFDDIESSSISFVEIYCSGASETFQLIATEIVKYRSIYNFYSQMVNDLKNLKIKGICRFILAKRTLQMVKDLCRSLSKRQRPKIPMKSSPQDWDAFTFSPQYKGLSTQVNGDMVLIKIKFDEIFKEVTKSFGANHVIVNNVLGVDLLPQVLMAIRQVVREIYNRCVEKSICLTAELGLALKLIMVYKLETKREKISLYHNLDQIKTSLATSDQQKFRAVKRFLEMNSK